MSGDSEVRYWRLRWLVPVVAWLALATALTARPAHAQEGAVTGQVRDASTLGPLVGAQVYFPRLDLGTLTDEQGQYRITGVPTGTHQLRVRLLGYRATTRSVTVTAGETVTANFQLSVSAVSLSEIVVTQTGTQRNRELGTAISTIDAAEEVQKSKQSSVQDLLKGRATGTTVRSSSGSVGTGQNFNIRGNSTLSLDATPLIYIDGIRVSNDNQNFAGQFAGNFFTGGQQTSRINDLNPEDIESIQVLKGPSATTLYGSEAASGVIVIETKQGRTGEAVWTARSEVGGNWDSTDWMGVAYDPSDDPSFSLTFGLLDSSAPPDLAGQLLPGVKDTVHIMNLLEGRGAGIADPFRTGLEQNYGGSVRGGFDDGNVTYYVSGEYEQLNGNLPANGVTKWSTRLNLNLSTSEKVDISLSNGFVSNFTELPQNDNNGFGFVTNALLGLAVFQPFDVEDPFTGGGRVRTCPLAFELTRTGLLGASLADLSADGVLCDLPGGAGSVGGPFISFDFDDSALTKTSDDTQRYTGSGTLTFRPWEPLTTRLTVGYDEFDQTNTQITPVTPRLRSISQAFDGFLAKGKTRGTNLTIQGTATADVELTGQLTSSTTGGFQWFDEQSDNVFIQCQTFPAGSAACDNSFDFQQTGSNDFFVEERTIGVFGEQQFGWRDRVFLTAGFRVDDNSAFGDQLGAEVFPQTSLSWVLSDEEFFPGFFEQFKLRGAWGQSGEQPPTNAAFSLLATNPLSFRGQDLVAVTPGAEPNGTSAAQPGNPELSPARVSEIEVGADLSILAGRLSGEFTWYRQTTEDDIVTRVLAPSTGFAQAQFTNVGELRNNGIEAALNATAFSLPDLTWDWRVQLSTNYNEITELVNPIDLGFEQRHAEGRPFGAYFDEAAFFNDQGEIEISDGAVFSAPGVPGGDPTPNVNGSLSTTLTLFNHVTLYGLAEMATGHQIHSNTQEFVCFFIHQCARVLEVGPDGEVLPDARLERAAGPPTAELNFVEDADYVKLRTVSLRLDAPDAWTRFFAGQDVSLQITGENLVHFATFFIDPEATSGGQGGPGIGGQGFFSEFGTVPPAKRVTASLQVSF